MGGSALPVPPDWFSAFARWHRLSLMRNPKTLREMREVMRGVEDPHRLGNLVALIEDEMGYRLYQTVSAAKAASILAPGFSARSSSMPVVRAPTASSAGANGAGSRA